MDKKKTKKEPVGLLQIELVKLINFDGKPFLKRNATLLREDGFTSTKKNTTGVSLLRGDDEVVIPWGRISYAKFGPGGL